jgi:glutaredoxin
VRIVLYTKPGCGLCIDMKQEIKSADCAELYTFEEVDIQNDPELFARYRYEIPVLCINGVEAFRHRLRADDFRAYVNALVGEQTRRADI